MSGALSNTQIPPSADDGEAALVDLRRQLDAVKQRMSEHRSQLRAAGLTRDEPADSPDA
ncbi:hypothetical protein [Phenylobacterium sp. J367]|uniref:hypothetical protein n=1 Tax=Phenylobacterium sp. J367 TaxID=2898435 RepID=UPI0021515904|nr:hypothetical protein [Phenylobacterium sp. J367]MCR5879408.1 hypothetical protein [Phenylobacterium sp. J367]